MCAMWMYSCSECLTNGKNRIADLFRLLVEGCEECQLWAEEELRKENN